MSGSSDALGGGRSFVVGMSLGLGSIMIELLYVKKYHLPFNFLFHPFNFIFLKGILILETAILSPIVNL